MPRLFQFQKDHAADKDKFAILTFHQSVKAGEKTLTAIEPEINKLMKGLWKIDKFPFPILMDATGRTPQVWGVSGYPTAFLIDPEGNVVAQGHSGIEEQLAAALKTAGEPKKATPKTIKNP